MGITVTLELRKRELLIGFYPFSWGLAKVDFCTCDGDKVWRIALGPFTIQGVKRGWMFE